MLMSLTILAFFAAEKGGEEGGGSLPQLDASTWLGQIFWLAIAFLVMFWLMNAVFLPKLSGIIEERKNRIADDYDQAAELKRQAEEAEAAYNTALADAKARAASIAADTREALDKEIAGMQAENDSKLEGRISAAEERIAQMSASAAEKVRDAATETTAAIVEAVIGKAPSKGDIAAAIDAATKGSKS